jgi:tRNA(fMet)-specific endonuclease VapC
MFILDTDHFTLLEWGSASAGQRLHERIRALPEGDVVTTIITFEEQTRGWLAFQAQARTSER